MGIVLVAEISWAEWEALQKAKAAKFWWCLGLRQLFEGRRLLERAYGLVEWLLLSLLAGWLLGLILTAQYSGVPVIQSQIDWWLVAVWFGPLLLWLLIGNIVLVFSDRVQRQQSERWSTSSLAFFCRWMWPHLLSGS
jgi:hypothetical protein